MIEKDKAKIESFLSKFYSEVDEIAKKYDNCCVNGCSYCCHQAIEMLSIESILISPFIKKYLSGVHLIRLKENMNKWFDYFDANTPDKEILSINDVYNEFRLKIGDDRVPCPFLIDNLCAIYPVRPLVCRSHFVQKSSLLCEKDSLSDACKDSQTLRKKGLQYITHFSKSFVVLLPFAVFNDLGIDRKTKKIEVMQLLE